MLKTAEMEKVLILNLISQKLNQSCFGGDIFNVTNTTQSICSVLFYFCRFRKKKSIAFVHKNCVPTILFEILGTLIVVNPRPL